MDSIARQLQRLGLMTIDHRRILIVDDDASIRELVAAALRPNGLTVDEASDGREAIQKLREHAYSVVLLDLIMPGADGFAVLDAISFDGGHSPVVLVVSGAEGRVLDRLDPRRIHGIVKKPFDAHELAAVVTACADIRTRSAFETMALATVMSSAPLITLL